MTVPPCGDPNPHPAHTYTRPPWPDGRCGGQRKDTEMDRITAVALDLAESHLDSLSHVTNLRIHRAAGEPPMTDRERAAVRDRLDWLAGYLRQAAKTATTEES